MQIPTSHNNTSNWIRGLGPFADDPLSGEGTARSNLKQPPPASQNPQLTPGHAKLQEFMRGGKDPSDAPSTNVPDNMIKLLCGSTPQWDSTCNRLVRMVFEDLHLNTESDLVLLTDETADREWEILKKTVALLERRQTEIADTDLHATYSLIGNAPRLIMLHYRQSGRWPSPPERAALFSAYFHNFTQWVLDLTSPVSLFPSIPFNRFRFNGGDVDAPMPPPGYTPQDDTRARASTRNSPTARSNSRGPLLSPILEGKSETSSEDDTSNHGMMRTSPRDQRSTDGSIGSTDPGQTPPGGPPNEYRTGPGGPLSCATYRLTLDNVDRTSVLHEDGYTIYPDPELGQYYSYNNHPYPDGFNPLALLDYPERPPLCGRVTLWGDTLTNQKVTEYTGWSTSILYAAPYLGTVPARYPTGMGAQCLMERLLIWSIPTLDYPRLVMPDSRAQLDASGLYSQDIQLPRLNARFKNSVDEAASHRCLICLRFYDGMHPNQPLDNHHGPSLYLLPNRLHSI